LRGVGRCWLRKSTGAEKERTVGDTARYPRIASSTPATITPLTRLCQHPHERPRAVTLSGVPDRRLASAEHARVRTTQPLVCPTSICAASFI
jgi:hypothetical protein